MPPVGTANHGASLVTSAAAPTMLPQLGPSDSGLARPRKDSAAWTSTAVAANSDSWTMIGPTSRGSTCRRMTCAEPSPDSRAACTYGSRRTELVTPRVTRSSSGQLMMPSTTMVAVLLPGKTDSTISSTMIPGSASSRSATQPMDRSSQPPK